MQARFFRICPQHNKVEQAWPRPSTSNEPSVKFCSGLPPRGQRNETLDSFFSSLDEYNGVPKGFHLLCADLHLRFY